MIAAQIQQVFATGQRGPRIGLLPGESLEIGREDPDRPGTYTPDPAEFATHFDAQDWSRRLLELKINHSGQVSVTSHAGRRNSARPTIWQAADSNRSNGWIPIGAPIDGKVIHLDRGTFTITARASKDQVIPLVLELEVTTHNADTPLAPDWAPSRLPTTRGEMWTVPLIFYALMHRFSLPVAGDRRMGMEAQTIFDLCGIQYKQRNQPGRYIESAKKTIGDKAYRSEHIYAGETWLNYPQLGSWVSNEIRNDPRVRALIARLPELCENADDRFLVEPPMILAATPGAY